MSLPAAFAPEVAGAMSALLSEIDPSQPYLSAAQPFLLYLAMPLCVASAAVSMMAPGVLASLALGDSESWAEALLKGLAFSLLLVSASAAVTQLALGRPLVGRGFFALLLSLAALSGLVLEHRVRNGAFLPAPFSSRHARIALASLLIVPLALLVALTPKIFWEAFNGDGAHTFESTRLLLHHPLPFWPPAAGDVSSWPGIAGMVSVYEASWFLRLFGEHEAAVRLPLLLELPLLFAAVVCAAEVGRDARLGRGALALIWGGVVSFGLVMSYSATYDPYSADMAMPAVMDSLVMIAVLGATAAFVRGQHGWLLVWSLLALMTGPAGLFQLGAALLGICVSAWPSPWRSALPYAGGLAACLVAIAIAPLLLAALGGQTPGSEHGPLRFLTKFGFIALADVERIAWSVLPTGLYPVASFFVWKRADPLSRILLVVTGSLFAMYYVMGFVSLHYFVPVMLLPLVVFWRSFDSSHWRAGPWLACGSGVAIALYLALPASHAIHTATRSIGERIQIVGFPGYDRMEPRIFAASQRLEALFPKDMHADVPEQSYGGSPVAWLYYSARSSDSSLPRNYLLAAARVPAPKAREIYRDELAAVYVYDERQWETDRHAKPANSNGKPVYAVERSRLFYRGAASERLGFFSPGKWLLGMLEAEH